VIGDRRFGSMPVDAAELRRAVGLGRLRDWLTRVAGGRARARVVVLLASVLALQTADTSTIGAVATDLEASFGISHTQLGFLAAVTALIGAAATLPFGVLVDRVPRVRLLCISIVTWSGAMALSALSSTYTMLVLTRVGLGAVMAAAGPALASLTGDLFPAAERARIYGYILCGELAGAAIGFLLSGGTAAALGWRGAFWVLAVPGLVLAFGLWRGLPEPARAGQSRLQPGSREIRSADEVADEPAVEPDEQQPRGESPVARLLRRRGVKPSRSQILRRDPTRMPLWTAVRYVLSVRTNTLLIAASALGYLFFAGVQTFAVIFVRAHYQLGQAAATAALSVLFVGAVAGVLLGGRLADRWLHRGRIDARIVLPAIAYLAAVAIFLPGFAIPWLALALPLYVLGTAALMASNPPLDAARLDIMHSRLWGRAEGVRTTVRMLAVAGAPLLFGLIADELGQSIPEEATSGRIPAGVGQGLDATFLIMLAPLALAGAILVAARRFYPRDLATAAASEQQGGA
jgi:predicted MFS family arabinose efflux permease